MNETNTSLVTIADGKAVTTSLKIAEVFGKEHCDVLKAIRNLNAPENWRDGNFAVSSYPQKIPNGGIKKSPMYLITRDGFTLLAMGFTGKTAMQFKLAYIEAFNRMEKIAGGNSEISCISRRLLDAAADSAITHRDVLVKQIMARMHCAFPCEPDEELKKLLFALFEENISPRLIDAEARKWMKTVREQFNCLNSSEPEYIGTEL